MSTVQVIYFKRIIIVLTLDEGVVGEAVGEAVGVATPFLHELEPSGPCML